MRDHAALRRERYRHRFHLMPPYGWMNDPNGAVFAFGKYHIFYQYNPFEAVWGRTYWGHFTSDDLAFWRWEQTALAPDMPYDAAGCYSGSSLVAGNTLVVAYTGASETGQTQCMAYSRDGIHFEKCARNPVIGGGLLPEHASPVQFRDPSVFLRDGTFYMLTVSEDDRGGTQFLLHRSEDTVVWQLCGCIYRDTLNTGMVECPGYFRLGEYDAILCSPQNVENGFLGKDSNLLLLGHMDWENYRFTPEQSRKVDFGFDYYAGQVFQSPDGRNIAFAWFRPYEYCDRLKEDGWAGALTLPRELEWEKGELFVRPARELHRLRCGECTLENVPVRGECEEEGFGGIFAELDLKVRLGEASVFSVRMFKNGDKYCELRYERESGRLIFDRSNCGEKLAQPYEPYIRSCEIGRTASLSLQIFLDNGAVEIFAQGGRYALCGYCMIDGGEGITFFSDKQALLEKAVQYDLKSIYETPEFPWETDGKRGDRNE